jgi:hypothetical protein
MSEQFTRPPPGAFKYGAPMGRSEKRDSDEWEGKIQLFKVRLDSGGYDQGGSYWGHDIPLYCARDEVGNEKFARAFDRASACQKMNLDVTRLARRLSK